MPLTKALLTHAHGLSRRHERVAFADDQPLSSSVNVCRLGGTSTGSDSSFQASWKGHYPSPAGIRKSWAIVSLSAHHLLRTAKKKHQRTVVLWCA
jgi:hypothetical protein